MKINAQKINKCNSLTDLQKAYKSIILKQLPLNNKGFEYSVMYYNRHIIIITNKNIEEVQYLERLKRSIIDVVNNHCINSKLSIRGVNI